MLDSTERHKDKVLRGEVLAPLWKLHVGLSHESRESKQREELVAKMVAEHLQNVHLDSSPSRRDLSLLDESKADEER
jgi:hypothetical protein